MYEASSSDVLRIRSSRGYQRVSGARHRVSGARGPAVGRRESSVEKAGGRETDFGKGKESWAARCGCSGR